MTPIFGLPLQDLHEVLEDPSYPVHEILYQEEGTESLYDTICNSYYRKQLYEKLKCQSERQGNIHYFSGSWNYGDVILNILDILANSKKGVLLEIPASAFLLIRKQILRDKLIDVLEVFYLIDSPTLIAPKAHGAYHIKNNRQFDTYFQSLSWMFDYGVSSGTSYGRDAVTISFHSTLYACLLV